MLLFCPISRIARPYGSMHGGCKQVDKLYQLQIRAARVIKGLTYETRSKDIFQNLQWSPINIIFKKREDIMTFKALRCMTPKYISDLFLPSFNSNYKLRSNGNKLDLELFARAWEWPRRINTSRASVTWSIVAFVNVCKEYKRWKIGK